MLDGLSMYERLSVLACATGLALIAAWFGIYGVTGHAPEQLAMMIAAVGGFEIHLFGRELHRRFTERRAGGKRG